MSDTPTASLSPDTVLCPSEGLDFVLISDNELLVQFGSRSRPSELFRDNDLSGVIGDVTRELLRGPSSFREILACVPEKYQDDARALVQSLVEQGMVSDAASDPVQQYLRCSFIGDTKLANSRVALIGAGPIAARVCRNLLQQGIAGIVLTDYRVTDAFWHSALPLGPTTENMGQPAQVALMQYLQQSGHPNVGCFEWDKGSGITKATAAADLVILALEQLDIQVAHLANRSCVQANRPWLMMVIDGNLGIIGPQFRPPETACFNDYQTLARAAIPSRAMHRKHRRYMFENPRTSFMLGLPGYADFVAGQGSIAATHFLIRGTSHLLGRVMIADFDGMRIDVEDVLKLPRCPVCATRRASFRPPFAEDTGTAEAVSSFDENF